MQRAIGTDFDARDLPLDEVLFANDRYRIPRYQRPYAWTIDQVTDFWNDVTGTGGSYFIGSLIFNYEHFVEDQVIEIIDGQQRMLTITILMAAIRDVAKTLGADDLAKRIQRNAIAFEDRRGNERLRIECGESTKDFFETYIQGGKADMAAAKPDTTEEYHIFATYAEIRKRIDEQMHGHASSSAKEDYLQKLWDKVGQLKVIRIKINSEDQAYEIFETVNARGLDLSVADLLKNLIFRKIKVKQSGEDPAMKMWSEIEQNVESADSQLTRFLRYYWLSKYSFVTERDLFKAIKQEVQDHGDFLRNLSDGSNMFNLLLSGTIDDWSNYRSGARIFESLRGIRTMKATQCHVLLLSIFRNLETTNSDPSGVVKLIENFTYNYSAIGKMQANRVEHMYSKYSIRIEKGVRESRPKDLSGNVQKVYAELKEEMRSLRPSKTEFMQKFMELEYGNSKDARRLIMYTLAKINALGTTGEHIIDFANVNTEHILPQKPEDHWNLTRSEVKDYVDKLGNLTPVHKKINSKIGNKDPIAKAEELMKSEIAMTKEVAKQLKQKGTWTQQDIEDRQRMLASLAYDDVWNF